MFNPSRFTTRRATFDFSSSDGCIHQVTPLLADDQLLANAIELIDWSDDPVQVRVCEQCGFVHCEPGGWLSLRNGGSAVLLIPAFSRMAENSSEYAPPKIVARHGFILIDLPGAPAWQWFACTDKPALLLAPGVEVVGD
jgi:hypothetical protein